MAHTHGNYVTIFTRPAIAHRKGHGHPTRFVSGGPRSRSAHREAARWRVPLYIYLVSLIGSKFERNMSSLVWCLAVSRLCGNDKAMSRIPHLPSPPKPLRSRFRMKEDAFHCMFYVDDTCAFSQIICLSQHTDAGRPLNRIAHSFDGGWHAVVSPSGTHLLVSEWSRET